MMLITIISQMVMAALLSTVQSRRILVKIFAWCYVGGICVIWLYGGVYCRNFEISGMIPEPAPMRLTTSRIFADMGDVD